MHNAKFGSRGFTLIASLLLLLLMSGFALGLLMMVNTEQRVGGFDLNNNYTYHATEGAIEKMTSDLAATFKSIALPGSVNWPVKPLHIRVFPVGEPRVSVLVLPAARLLNVIKG